MLFEEIRERLLAMGYSDDTADAKIAHDIVLKAVRDAGFHDNLTVKGGVVMSGLTDVVRRATMDMDVDFLHYSLSNESIRRFVSRINRAAPCKIGIRGKIVELKQQEYKGKRIYLVLADEAKREIETKIDIGVHTREDVRQGDFGFRSVTDGETIMLLVNSKEQIFVEKLKSLLRFGSASTRFKDVYDMCYLSSRVDKNVLRDYVRLYVLLDQKMRERDVEGVCRRLRRVFADKDYMSALADPTYAWMDVKPEIAAQTIVDCIASLGPEVIE